jgi:hypothetical protein
VKRRTEEAGGLHFAETVHHCLLKSRVKADNVLSSLNIGDLEIWQTADGINWNVEESIISA